MMNSPSSNTNTASNRNNYQTNMHNILNKKMLSTGTKNDVNLTNLMNTSMLKNEDNQGMILKLLSIYIF